MLNRLFGRKEIKPFKENEVRVTLPEETYTIMEWEADNLPCVGILNSALKNFEHKKIFGWHLSVIIDFTDTIDNGMPSAEELKLVDPFCDKLDEAIKATDNALFLVRENWNNTRRLVWRVYYPEVAHDLLQHIVDNQQHPRPFDWHMEQDLEWKQAEWYFEQL